MEASIKKEITTAYDTYPENLMTEIKHFIGKPDDITNEEIRSFMVLNDREIEKFIKTGSYQMGNYFLEFKYVYQSDKSVFKIGKYLLRKNAPDIFGIYFSGVDVVSHLYWHFMEPQYFKKHNISPDHILRFEKVIEHYYELVDQFIAGLLKVADSSYTIIIASDHGFGPTGNLPWSGGHGKITPGAPVAPDGILIINGNNIRKGEQLNNASVLDVLPTILYLFGMPLAKDFEGKVLLSAFDDNYQRKPQYIDSYDTIHSKISDAPLMGDPARDSDLLNKLKGLGYVE
jgi:predicted AlkP superfamily phosphohydrolase/phosphomutase